MGLFGQLVGRGVRQIRGREADSVAAASDLDVSETQSINLHVLSGEDDLEVVGECHYQPALWAICDSQPGDWVRHDVTAVLVPEPENPYDINAIRVDIGSQTVGYLSRSDAAAYLPGLLKLMSDTASHIGLVGVVVGGGVRDHGLGYLGLWLEHDRRHFGNGLRKPPGLSQGRQASVMRTGFSEAWLTDLDDDSYDLTWYSELPDADLSAITELRSLLETDPDPIDRHFQFGELERRLYRRREVDGDALTNFDDVCRQHDAEMDRIRQALHSKFGKVPLLETYKQMAIRQQKDKNWASSKWWAERGLQLYGNDAADVAWVDDLRKRFARAQAKLEEPARVPRTSGRVVEVCFVIDRPSTPPFIAPAEIDVLTCGRCNSEFERLRVRGRKPTLCPDCSL